MIDLRTIGCGMTAPEFSANHAHDLDCYRKVSPSEILESVLSLEGVETVEWCKEHQASTDEEATPMGAVACWKALKGLGDSNDCSVVSRVLVPIPEEETE